MKLVTLPHQNLKPKAKPTELKPYVLSPKLLGKSLIPSDADSKPKVSKRGPAKKKTLSKAKPQCLSQPKPARRQDWGHWERGWRKKQKVFLTKLTEILRVSRAKKW